MTTLVFLTLLWVAGFVAWITDRAWPWTDTAAAIPAAIIAGLGAGILIGAWDVSRAEQFAFALLAGFAIAVLIGWLS